MSIKGWLWQLKLAHLALIYAIHGIDDVCKNERKELLLSRGGDDGSTCHFVVFDIFCSSLLLSFFLSVNVIIIVYALKL